LKGGKISARGALILFVYYIKLILAIPPAFMHFVVYAHRIKTTPISLPPIFILGHYRSGTTYLQKLMVSDKRFGFVTNYEGLFPYSNLFFGNWLQRLLQFLAYRLNIKNLFFNDTITELADPLEDDQFLIFKASAFSAYWGFVFPGKFSEWLNCSNNFRNDAYRVKWEKEYLALLKTATFKNKGKQLVLKNPPNTERIKYLLELFPDAKFIYIYRNPIDVFYSMRNVWHTAILKLYCLQKPAKQQIDGLILEHMVYLADQYEKQKKLIPPENLFEVKYEELEKDPFTIIEEIYSKLDLPDFGSTSDDLLRKLKQEKRYHKFKYFYDEDALRMAEQKLEKYIKQWSSKSTELIH
jgi:hypothetical protein